MEIVRLLHTFGGPMLALFGGMGARSVGTLVTGLGRSVGTVDFSDAPRPCKPYRPERERIVSGDPAQTVSFAFKSEDGHFSAGTWTCQPGKWHIDFAQDEFVHILEGVVIVTDSGGLAKTYRAGDAFISPAGFSGTWDVREPVRKYFTLSGPPA
ncbi:cupin domain-containing protein [Methylobacterium sp. 77]|uniref:cupin domain-containing protein n=1 Tax=Methylobacterium sp. 77 TaxID=1101192 RepID=UPI000378588C|nr:cupin domain-containing protein [Methylobacterium sp. 77]